MSEVLLALIVVPIDESEDPPEQWLTDGRIPELDGVSILWSRRERVASGLFHERVGEETER